MAHKIQVKRGNKTDLPTLDVGEFGLCQDTNELFIGNSGNQKIFPPTALTISNVEGLQTALDGKVDDSQVLTNVPANAKFTDTVTTINGKTGAITKEDITALGIPAQDTVYTHPATHSADMIVDGTTNKAYTATEKTKLAGIATGAEVNVNADWNASSGDAQILNKPTLATVATSGAYSDLTGKPTIPDKLADLTADATHRLVTDTEKSTWNGKADDSAVVHDTGNETVAGVKTFSSFPVTPSSAPTTDYQVANKKYVDDNAGGSLYDQIGALSAVTPVSADLFPFNDVSGSVAGKVTLTNLLTAFVGIGCCRVGSGYYTGTGNYGSSNKCSIDMNFVPKLLCVFPAESNASLDYSVIYGANSEKASIIVPYSALVDLAPLRSSDKFLALKGNTYIEETYSLSNGNKTLSWYSSSAANQLNESGLYYYYVYIG